MVIETNRLILREWKSNEENDLDKILGDSRVMYAYNQPFNEKEIREWLHWNLNSYKENGYGLWAIERKYDNKIIGECGITDQTINGVVYAEIGYHLMFDYWHQGYAIEAAQATKKAAFEIFKKTEVVSIVRDTNISSMNVAIKNGMTIKERFTKIYSGTNIPHYLFMKRYTE
ncbi:GNAT family N-acetyltransferase [Lactobacillus sp. YT155]|uniref:GNAT family N-acetyltransferase n=1 Tax=Lactobacillus sp. YT155 TaxID=3060955 RepID=UPI00265DAE12|nr:GNAT family N-acetyltransferase [Lactobacillus sp. YT155]MDO1604530.1 GNAT family N-acetyltransferase [Lactobacillus sp. YT155]